MSTSSQLKSDIPQVSSAQFRISLCFGYLFFFVVLGFFGSFFLGNSNFVFVSAKSSFFICSSARPCCETLTSYATLIPISHLLNAKPFTAREPQQVDARTSQASSASTLWPYALTAAPKKGSTKTNKQKKALCPATSSPIAEPWRASPSWHQHRQITAG